MAQKTPFIVANVVVDPWDKDEISVIPLQLVNPLPYSITIHKNVSKLDHTVTVSVVNCDTNVHGESIQDTCPQTQLALINMVDKSAKVETV